MKKSSIPTFAKGPPVAPLDKILATQAELIEKVRNSLGFTVDDFNRLVLPVIQRYAAFVHLLPASESHHHRGAGGLFRHGLEVAFWAAQASESVIFSIEGRLVNAVTMSRVGDWRAVSPGCCMMWVNRSRMCPLRTKTGQSHGTRIRSHFMTGHTVTKSTVTLSGGATSDTKT